MVAKSPNKTRPKRSPARTPAVIAKQAAAVELAVKGETYEAIARILGYADHSGARRAVQAGLAEALQKSGVEELRQLELERLERLQSSRWERATGGGDDDAYTLVLQTMKQRAALLGLNAPIQHTGPENGPINVNVQVNVGLELKQLGDDELAHLQAIAGKLALGNDATARD